MKTNAKPKTVVEKRATYIQVTRGPWDLIWDHAGEGYFGDYDPKDKKDAKLLRASLLYKGDPCSNQSYCTLAPVGTDVELLVKASEVLFAKLPKPTRRDRGQWLLPTHEMEMWTHRKYPKLGAVKTYHVVLKRVVNIIVDNVEARSPSDALAEAVKQLGDDNIYSLNGTAIDDGEQFVGALVDEYDCDRQDYAKELVFDMVKGDPLTFKKQPRS